MGITLDRIPRPDKSDVTAAVLTLLAARLKKGPPEDGLDGFIPELTDVGQRLALHVTGNVAADAARQTRGAKADVADDDVDTLFRHIESYLAVEGLRRTGTWRILVLALRQAAFPRGLEPIDERIVDENRYLRDSLVVLQDPENAPTLKGINFPVQWIQDLGAALDVSDAENDGVVNARTDKTDHVAAGQDAEVDFVDVFVRLRRYIGSRAKRTDKARIEEGRDLLRPLLDLVKKLDAEAAARATRKATEKAKADAAKGAAGTGGTP